MSVASRMVTGNPTILTIFFAFGGLFCTMLAPDAEVPISYKVFYSLIFLSFFALIFLWLWAIYWLGTYFRRTPPTWTPVFLIAPVWLAATNAMVGYEARMGGSTLASLLSFAAYLLVGVSVWKSAEALETALVGDGATVGKIASTAVSMLFPAVGVWVLRPRLLALANIAKPESRRDSRGR